MKLIDLIIVILLLLIVVLLCFSRHVIRYLSTNRINVTITKVNPRKKKNTLFYCLFVYFKGDISIAHVTARYFDDDLEGSGRGLT
jgi:hypothetical protein